ncbi:MAG: S9 family peptidase, partial [Acidobacteriota bacterium]|nr:S9 family peptidase [Acidobacteriota bacterium]
MRETPMKVFSMIAAAIIASTSFTAVISQTRRTFMPGDILRVANVSDAQISPNAQWVIYTVSTVEGNETLNTLWLARVTADFGAVPASTLPATTQRRTSEWPSATSTATPLLASAWNASNPRWSPDSSTIAFLGNRNDQPGIWIVSPTNSEPRFVAPLTSTNFFITYAGEPLAWAPDSKRIAYVSATEESPLPDDPKVIDRIQYKSRTSFSDNRRTHVWITAVEKPEPRQLTSGPFYDHAITFNPKGEEIAFLSNHEADPDANNNSDIFAVDLHGELRQITQTRGCEYEPTWSPDGKWIAYTATRRDITTIDSIAEDAHVWVTDAAGSNQRELNAEQDRRARSPQWSADSQFVFYLAGDEGCTSAFSVAASGGRKSFQIFGDILDREKFYLAASNPGLRPPRNQYQVTGFSVAHKRNPSRSVELQQADPTAGSLLAFTLSAATLPGEVWLQRAWADGRRLTRHNDGLASHSALIEPDEFKFQSFDGTRIQGWLMKPAGWREDRKYPLILSIHGGPHGMYGWAFNPSFQVYAAHGYAVLYLNPRGSTGYGQKFSDGTLNEWGGGDYKDLMAGVDSALRKYSWIDQDHMGVTGGSYGGFMTNWIITQTPRFKAAVSVASVSNLISFYSTSLYQDLIHAEFGGFPWDNYDLLWQWSPLRYAKQAQT